MAAGSILHNNFLASGSKTAVLYSLPAKRLTASSESNKFSTTNSASRGPSWRRTTAPVAVNIFEPGEYLLLQQPFVGICIFDFGPSPPMTCDHGFSLSH